FETQDLRGRTDGHDTIAANRYCFRLFLRWIHGPKFAVDEKPCYWGLPAERNHIYDQRRTGDKECKSHPITAGRPRTRTRRIAPLLPDRTRSGHARAASVLQLRKPDRSRCQTRRCKSNWHGKTRLGRRRA